jgi:hypothetical protein
MKRKLGLKIVDCVFLGYAFHSVGYRLLIIKFGIRDMHVGTIIESRDVTFFENIFPMKETPSSSSHEFVKTPENNDEIVCFEQPLEENYEKDDNEVTRKSKRQKTAKSFGDDFIVYLVDDTSRTIAEAYESSDADYWKEAISNEMDSIMSNGT